MVVIEKILIKTVSVCCLIDHAQVQTQSENHD